MKHFLTLFVVSISLPLSGCGSVLSMVGPNTYMASGGSVYGNTSLAAETCQKQGKQVRVTQMVDKFEGGHVMFTCMSPSDPNYNKPVQLEKTPDVIIQDNRK
jgi:uncharacterized protein YceK